jgi:hypothetical protein
MTTFTLLAVSDHGKAGVCPAIKAPEIDIGN